MENDRRHLRFLAAVAALVALGAGAVAGFNWLVDPLQFYRKAGYPPEISRSKRYQNPGLARNYPRGTVLIGTSFSENFAAGEVEPVFGGPFLNLAMSGASMREQKLLLDVAMRAGGVRAVIWELNYEYLRGAPDWVSDYDGPFPRHLYNGNPLDEIPPYLLSIDTLKASASVAAGMAGLVPWEPEPLFRAQSWEWRKGKKGPEALRKFWRDLRAPRGRPLLERLVAEMTVENMNRSFDENALPAVRAHPGTRFLFFFPPVSVLRHLLFEEAGPGTLGRIVENKRHIARALRDFPNAELHDFQGVEAIVADFSRYYDPGHFCGETGRELLGMMARREHLATGEKAGEVERLTFGRPAGEWLERIGWEGSPEQRAERAGAARADGETGRPVR